MIRLWLQDPFKRQSKLPLVSDRGQNLLCLSTGEHILSGFGIFDSIPDDGKGRAGCVLGGKRHISRLLKHSVLCRPIPCSATGNGQHRQQRHSPPLNCSILHATPKRNAFKVPLKLGNLIHVALPLITDIFPCRPNTLKKSIAQIALKNCNWRN